MPKKRKILMISPTPSHPPDAGNRARINALLSMLKEMGHDVYFLHVQREKGDMDAMRRLWGDRYIPASYKRPVPRRRTLMRRLISLVDSDAPYIYSIDEWYDPSLDQTLRKLDQKHEFDTVIVEYVFFSKALNCFGPDVQKIIDTHDAFANRHRHYLKRGEQPKWFSTTAKEESKGFDRADIIIAIQDRERELFSEMTNKTVITVGHMVQLNKTYNPTPEKRILFLASDNYINVQGAIYFLHEVFPRVRETVPDVQFVLAGSVCNSVDDLAGLVKLGRVDDLKQVYETASVVINPVLISTGLSIKNIEAMGYSLPLVTLVAGVNGIKDGASSAYLLAEDSADFADKINQVLVDNETARELSDNAYDYACKWNHKMVKQLENILN